MKTPKLFIFLFIMQLCTAQNHDLIKEEAMLFFNNGKVQEALQTLEQIKDQQTLENTNVNIWKKHCKEILEFKFLEEIIINDSVKIITVKTGLLAHFGIYNSNAKKYIITPVYDDITASKNSNYGVVNLNNQNALIDLSGKTIIPFGDYKITRYDKFALLTSNDGNSTLSIYSLEGKLLVNNLKSVYLVSEKYFMTQNELNKFGLFDTEKAQFIIENCDKIENIDGNFGPYTKGVFIKRDNKSELYSFTTSSFSAQNAFDEIITKSKGINSFFQFQNKADKENTIERNKHIIVKKNSKYGIYNLTQEKYDTEPVYDSINHFYNCLKNKVWKNLKYDYPIKEDFDYLSEAVVFRKNNLYGLKSISNKIIAAAQYDEIDQITTSLFLIKKQKLWGWISVEKNKISIIKPQFDHVYQKYNYKYDYTRQSFDKEYLVTQEQPYLETCFKNKIKKFSLDGTVQVDFESKINKGFTEKEYPQTDWSYNGPKSDRVLTTQTKFANYAEKIPSDQKLFGLDDTNGNEIIKPFYTEIDKGLANQFLVVYDDRAVGAIDENGKVIIPLDYKLIEPFDSKYYIVKDNRYFGLLDKDGKEVFPLIYKEIKVFSDGFYLVKDMDDWCKIVDNQNKTIYVFPKYTEKVYTIEKIVTHKNEVLYNLKFRLKAGYEYWDDHFLIKIENNLATRFLEKYKIEEIYDNKIVEIKSSNLIGFYDLNNQKLIEPKFSEIKIIYSKTNKLIYCKTDNYFDTIVDENLNATVSKDNISYIINNVIFYEKNGKYGFFDKKNKKTKSTFEKIDVNDPIYASNEKFYKFYDNGKRAGIVNDDGKIIIKGNLYDKIHSISSIDELLFNKKYAKEELGQILVCIDNSDKTTNKIDFLTVEGNKIASTTVDKKDYSFYFRNGIIILILRDEQTIFFDLHENKIISKVNGFSFNNDHDRAYTILKNNTSASDSKVMAQKYSTKGNLISEQIIDRNLNTQYLPNWNYYLIQKKGNKYGIIDVNEKIHVPFVFDSIMLSVDSVYIAKNNNKYGIIDRYNNVLLNVEYDKIETQYLPENRIKSKDVRFIEDYEKRTPYRSSFNFVVSKDQKTGILGPTLKTIMPVEFDSFGKERTLFGPIITRKGNISMVYDYQNHFLFEVQCDSLLEDKNSNPVFYKIYKNGKQGFLDQKGKMIFSGLFPKVEKTNIENLFMIEKDSKKYIVNSEGEITSNAYDEINTSIIYNYAVVRINNKFGLLNQKATLVVPEIYDSIQILSNNYLLVYLDGKFGIIDLNTAENKILPIKIPVSYAQIKQIEAKKYIIVSDPFKTGVIDFNNKTIIPIIYDSVYYQENGKYFVCTNNGVTSYLTCDNIRIQINNNSK
ncbi:WG repeat-containing protein [Flavobacterium sp. MC2016-06]|uniref:WG repeat-containing protein n=1 Tax=Flavobacterium sp. MC2016-06 TaxID=2676308 RepID=UPI0012BA76B2|nr:WG repeat-containing protein [Flavobacterium sp. MC2016-06]MBU3860671.1 WG repeat-containing protein [Flavobacterium sp. MC2016-06]